ncbi:hypothetical protein EV643_12012 [Kribbella sp. VKM Ac-2527]|uniref:Pycsar effector protein domain-containing protein n=1 Tax=Kribbella caucasensis TaxID=2512215 RepID=A0A4R6JKP7_9ACTN|nr:Pycsar system effector family protein [Kribbella sp. VKM Ac-2527]TDO36282.1 hypothetical protein EV643_12012 [Kribbella sp. VKM Ac-2527]
MTDDVSACAEVILAAAREEIGRADAKASILLAGAGVVVGALLASALSSDWSPARLVLAAAILWWLSIAAVALGLGMLGYCIYPQTKRIKNGGSVISYFGDVVGLSRLQLEAALEESVAEPRSAVLDQLLQVSAIAARKYWAISAALRLMLFGTIGAGLAIAVDTWLS